MIPKSKYNKSQINNSRTSNKSQITAFVILGILILASFAFMLHVRNIYITSKLKREAKRTVKTFVENMNIDYYITSCLDRITKQAIQISATQGGVIWDYQNGSVNFNKTAIGKEWLSFNETEYYNKTFNVSYGLLDNASRICLINSQQQLSPIIQYPEPWPFQDTRLSAIPSKYWRVCETKNVSEYFKETFPGIFGIELKKVSGALGINVLTRLCDWFGPNKYDVKFKATGICNSWNEINLFKFPALLQFNTGVSHNSMYSKNISVQREIEEYISKKLPQCINISFLAKLYPYNITNVSKPNITLILTDKKVIPRASYEFNVTLKGGKQVSVIQEFEAPIKTRFKQVYTLTSALITLEAQDPLHMIATTPYLFMNNVNTSVIEAKCEDVSCKHDKILRVVDYESQIFGKPLTLFVGIKNRRPVLDYIGDGKTQGVDLTFLEKDTIVLNPLGVDPDDFPVFYNYRWWLEDYDEYFNKSCCAGFGGSVNCSNISNLRNCMIVNTSIKPHNFTNSSLFLRTRQNASYNLTHKDMGLHFLKIETWDESNLDDWQNISILVIDLPQPVLNFSNPYNNTDNSYASVEDPFLLNASKTVGSAIGGGSIISYEFRDLTEGWTRITNHDKPYIWVPKAWEDAGNNINKLSRLIENISEEHFNITGEHNITITVNTSGGLSNTNSYVLNVTNCIPFRSPIPTYPYNNLSYPNSNPFFANHSCCIGNISNGSTWRFADTTTSCFTKKEYGVIISSAYPNINKRTNFDYSKYNIQIPGYGASIDAEPLPSVAIPESNDVYSMVFDRKCGGNRGNICSGDMSVQYRRESSCYYNTSLDEQCIGPSLRAIQNPEATTEDDKECVNYTGTTFEELLAENGLLNPNNIQGSCLHGAFCDGDVLKKNFGCDNGVCTPGYEENCSEKDGCYQSNNKVDNCNNPPCYYRDYYCNQGSESCSFSGIEDPDDNPQYCSSCGLEWLNLGGNHKCCGDDINEYTLQCREAQQVNLCLPDDYGCCPHSNDCVYNHICYASGHNYWFGNTQYYCDDGVWEQS